MALSWLVASWFGRGWSARRFVSCVLVGDALELDGAEVRLEDLRWADASGTDHHRVVTFWVERDGQARTYRVLGAARHRDRLEELVGSVIVSVVESVRDGDLTLESASPRDRLVYRLVGAASATALAGAAISLFVFFQLGGLGRAIGVGLALLAVGLALFTARAQSGSLDARGVRLASGLAPWPRHTFLPIPGGALLVVPRLERLPRGPYYLLELVLGLVRDAPVVVEGIAHRTNVLALLFAPPEA